MSLEISCQGREAIKKEKYKNNNEGEKNKTRAQRGRD